MENVKPPAYSLVICEKPEAARRVAYAIGGSTVTRVRVRGVEVFRLRNEAGHFVVCAAVGHLYSVSNHYSGRNVFPVLDLDWFPACQIGNKLSQVRQRIEAIGELAKNAAEFVNACDFDVEGETIGHNILKYACGGKESVALRAKFSSLTDEEVKFAFIKAKKGVSQGLANAGRARHLVDFIWGVNLSRILSESTISGNRYRTISIGRVQGPALAFAVNREAEIRTFVPKPYWRVVATFQKNGLRVTVPYLHRINRLVDVDEVKKSCEGSKGLVSQIRRFRVEQAPPPPFNTGELQREAFRLFRYPPFRTMEIAERLYLGALISYPRTDSQKIPHSIDCEKILRDLAKLSRYANYANELLRGKMIPRQGQKDDSAHPAIHPTGQRLLGESHDWESKLFDLIVRRFLACLSDEAILEKVFITINVGKFEFQLSDNSVLRDGWMRYYGYPETRGSPIPDLSEGDTLELVGLVSEADFESSPPRFNESTLVEKMESERIGTKSTRVEIVRTLVRRGYLSERNLEPTELGFAIFEMMEEYAPQIVSTHLTRETENKLVDIQNGKDDGKKVVEETVDTLEEIIKLIKPFQPKIGLALGESVRSSELAKSILGNCPVCGSGKLRIVRSFKTRKRFVGCTNYPNICQASAPLPQRGMIRNSRRKCQSCGWPIVMVLGRGRRPWRLCVNSDCGTKSVRKNEMQALPQRSQI